MSLDIGKRLRELRELKGYPTVDSFAAAVGLSRSRISNLENNRSKKPRRSSLMFLLSKLGVSEDEFFHPRPAKSAIRDSQEEPAYKLPPEDRLSGLNSEERKLIEKLLDLLRSEVNPADVKGSITANVNSFWEFLPAREKTVRVEKKGKKAS